ncbi:hypothetical protein D3C76_1044260 [compost metagenome]
MDRQKANPFAAQIQRDGIPRSYLFGRWTIGQGQLYQVGACLDGLAQRPFPGKRQALYLVGTLEGADVVVCCGVAKRFANTLCSGNFLESNDVRLDLGRHQSGYLRQAFGIGFRRNFHDLMSCSHVDRAGRHSGKVHPFE